MPPYVVTDFKDHNKQKNLVVVVLPTGVAQNNTTNTNISVGSAQDIVWPHNMTVKTLLEQFLMSWQSQTLQTS